MDNRYLFRGMANGKWIIGNYIFDPFAGSNGRHAIVIFGDPVIQHLDWVEAAPATIGQCTGLSAIKSYRGDLPEDLLVWEGDVFKHKVDINNNLHGDYAIYEFIYLNGILCCSYVSSEKETKIPKGYLCSPYYELLELDMKTVLFSENLTLDEIEIIGNIHGVAK